LIEAFAAIILRPLTDLSSFSEAGNPSVGFPCRNL